MEEERIGMPGMGFQETRGRVVRCHDQDLRFKVDETRNVRIDLFDGLDFSLEISILTGGVGFFEVDLEEVVTGVIGFDGGEEVLGGFTGMEDCHADDIGQSLVHRILGDCGRFYFVEFVKRRDGGRLGEPS